MQGGFTFLHFPHHHLANLTKNFFFSKMSIPPIFFSLLVLFYFVEIKNIFV